MWLRIRRIFFKTYNTTSLQFLNANNAQEGVPSFAAQKYFSSHLHTILTSHERLHILLGQKSPFMTSSRSFWEQSFLSHRFIFFSLLKFHLLSIKDSWLHKSYTWPWCKGIAEPTATRTRTAPTRITKAVKRVLNLRRQILLMRVHWKSDWRFIARLLYGLWSKVG